MPVLTAEKNLNPVMETIVEWKLLGWFLGGFHYTSSTVVETEQARAVIELYTVVVTQQLAFAPVELFIVDHQSVLTQCNDLHRKHLEVARDSIRTEALESEVGSTYY